MTALTILSVNPIFCRGRKRQEMIRELLKKLSAILRCAAARNGKSKATVEILKADYHDLRRLAEQISNHAEKAPYPHVTQRLRQIASEKRNSTSILKEKLLSLGGGLEEFPLDLKSGKNHWERMVQDLQDQKALETSFFERTMRLADEAPEISDLLRKVVDAQLPHKEALLDLVARADPQAELS
ncbi:MAG: hypothetical protein AAB222_03070 [Candidatus Binatota bacterium]